MISRNVTDEYPLFLPEPDIPRSPGIHVSSIIRCIATETGILNERWAEELSLQDVRIITDPDALLRINIGLAWDEWYLTRILPRYGVSPHPPEIQYEGVYFSLDGEDLSVTVTVPTLHYSERVHEVKSTSKSTKTVGDFTSQWMWICQVKAYCKAKGCNSAVVHVLFLYGDYKAPIPGKFVGLIRPVIKVWELEFTDEELSENWELLDMYKRERLLIEGRNATT